MVLIDSHTHLYVSEFDADREAVVQRARNAGVGKFLLPAIDSSYSDRMQQMKVDYPDEVFLMTGLHPTHVKENYEEELEHVATQLQSGGFCAVGEIGIDLYWEKKYLPLQQRAFDTQIRWAKQHQLPIVIHCRDAFEAVFEVLQDHEDTKLKGIFHCFTGTLEHAHQALAANLLLGIGGVVTFKNGNIDQFLHQIPLTSIALETDAPYLAPTPFRGKRNESAYITYVLARLAEIYALPKAAIAEQTTTNVSQLFQLL